MIIDRQKGKTVLLLSLSLYIPSVPPFGLIIIDARTNNKNDSPLTSSLFWGGGGKGRVGGLLIIYIRYLIGSTYYSIVWHKQIKPLETLHRTRYRSTQWPGDESRRMSILSSLSSDSSDSNMVAPSTHVSLLSMYSESRLQSLPSAAGRRLTPNRPTKTQRVFFKKRETYIRGEVRLRAPPPPRKMGKPHKHN